MLLMLLETREMMQGMEEASATKLTSRELNVLGLLVLGLSNRLIAQRLEISEKTVKNHLSSVYVKIGATDRTQAALYAQHVGLTDPGKAALIDPPPEGGSPSTGPTLTARERGVLRLLAVGLSNRGIARRLEISEKTVKNHLSSIYLKIGAVHRTQAALYAQCVGLAS
jgi:DNA-binding NarL/FixJ family response regulator